jgi:hypothetical protein
MPGSGGSYHYLREAYGSRRLGGLMSFLDDRGDHGLSLAGPNQGRLAVRGRLRK